MSSKLKVASLVTLALLITTGFAVSIFVLPPPLVPSSSPPLQITHGVATRSDSVLSPNGRYIAYSSNQSGTFSIWISTTSGSQLTRVTDMSGDQVLPQWSPLGNTISFIWKHDSFSDLCLVGVLSSASNHECVTSEMHVQDYSWSPNSQIIAYDDRIRGNIHLYYVATNVTTLFKFNEIAMDPEFGKTSNVLYFSATSGNESYIWGASLDGSNAERLSWEGSDTRPEVSPTGDQVMFLCNQSGRPEPWLIDLNTDVVTYLFDRPNLASYGYGFPPAPKLAIGTIPQWSSNGSQLLMIASTNETYGTLFLVTLDFLVTSEEMIPNNLIPAGTTYYLNIFNPVPVSGSVSFVQWIPNGNGFALISANNSQIFVLQSGAPTVIGYGG